MRDALVEFSLESAATRSPFLTYEPYYGLKEKAFSLSADPRFLYKSCTHASTFDALRAGIRRREGIIVLTGEPGTGKTMYEALDVVYNESKGNPRVTNLIVDKSLSRGYLDRTWLITPGVVTAALGDLGYAKPAPSLSPSDDLPAMMHSPVDDDEHILAELLTPPAAAMLRERRGRPRLRRAALLVTIGVVLAGSGFGLNEWQLRRQELTQPVPLPIVSAPLPPPVSAGPAPVIPPAEFFAPVLP